MAGGGHPLKTFRKMNFSAKDLLKEIEIELGGKLTAHQRIIGGCELYKIYGFNCRIAPEQIEEATETIIKAIFINPNSIK